MWYIILYYIVIFKHPVTSDLFRMRPMVLLSDLKKTNLRQPQLNEQPRDSIPPPPTRLKPTCGPIVFPDYSCEEETTYNCLNGNNGQDIGLLHNNQGTQCNNVNSQAEQTRPQTRPEQTRPQTRPGQTRPEQTRPEQTRPEQTRPGQTRPEQTRPEPTRPEQTWPEQIKRLAVTDGYLRQKPTPYTNNYPPRMQLPKNQPMTMGTKPIRNQKTTSYPHRVPYSYGKQHVQRQESPITKEKTATTELAEPPEIVNKMGIFVSSTSTDPPFPGNTKPAPLDISGETRICDEKVKCYKHVWRTKKKSKVVHHFTPVWRH